MAKISEEFKSKFFTAEEIKAKPIRGTISTATVEVFKDDGGRDKNKVVLEFAEHDQKLILNATNRGIMVDIGGDDTDDWEGKVIEVVPTKVMFAGKRVDSILVREPKQQARAQRPEKPGGGTWGGDTNTAQLPPARPAKPAPTPPPAGVSADAEDPAEDIEIPPF